jgi:hypothetical protein
MSCVAAASKSTAAYKRREPETTALHKIVRDNLDPFLRFTREHYSKPLPGYVERELRRYVKCGLLSAGFTRLKCARCGADMLLGFSCKTRICPSCAGRRMAQSGAHLAEHVLPAAPLRQWVLSVPWQLRELLAAKAAVVSSVIRIFQSVVLGWYRQRGRDLGCARAETGSVIVQQRFGSSVNLHVHLHAAWIDGVFDRNERTGQLVFHFVPAPTHDDIQALVDQVARRVLSLLTRQGWIGEPQQDSNETNPIDAAMQGCRKAALGRGRFEKVNDRGCSQPSLFDDDNRFDHRTRSAFAAERDGFSVHAGVSFSALDRKGRESLVRYMLRPAIAVERVSILRDGAIAYRTKYRTRSGATHRVMTPIEFMCRLAALVPPPRVHMVRYYGVLAPASPLRKLVVPAQAEPGCEHPGKPQRPAPASPGAASQRAVDKPPLPVAGPGAEPTATCTTTRTSRSARTSVYIPWSVLLAKTFGVDALACPRCKKGRLRPVAVMTKHEIVARILSHLHLPLTPEQLSDQCTIVYDVTDQPMPGWALGSDPEQPEPEADERGPPEESEGIDPPCAED